ncbi:MAG: bile acid:sodium symporter family protein [Mesorhizobium sp.]|nr:bile acid:sodium symporter family protein [Mesorhizobium sp.]MBL8575988.1 bile acid:sodium symporter family protein [Mesorhizobium sp.]
MQQSLTLSIGLPAGLVIVMLGLGLSLRIQDFTRYLSRPWPIVLGLLCQIVLLPLLCFALIYAVDFPPAISVGMMLLAASPGGTSAALFTHLARGDVALSLILAAATTLIALVSLPVIVNLSMIVFYGEARTVRLDIAQVLLIFAIAVVPASIGVFVRSRFPDLAERLDRPVKTITMIFLVGLISIALIGQWRLLVVWGPTVGLVTLIFAVLSLLVGYCLPLLLGVEPRQAVALSMSIGIHNAALVIALAMSEHMLNNAEMAIPPAAYGVIAYIVGGIFVWILNRRQAVS